MADMIPETKDSCGCVGSGSSCPLKNGMRWVFQTPTLWIPLVLLGVATLVFRWTDADLTLARLFFKETDPDTSWPFGEEQPWRGLYDYGVYPAWVLGTGGLVVWLAAFVWKKVQPIRDEGLFLALVLFLGPGLLVNVVFKPCFGRPRPHLTKPFGGEKDFLPILVKGDNSEGDCTSFPCGHASTGFYLMAPAFFLYGRRNGWAAAFLGLGLAAGCVIGVARMTAGGHFASDVLWSAAFVYFTGLALAVPFGFWKRGSNNRPAKAER